jgi:hypothetical protein
LVLEKRGVAYQKTKSFSAAVFRNFSGSFSPSSGSFAFFAFRTAFVTAPVTFVRFGHVFTLGTIGYVFDAPFLRPVRSPSSSSARSAFVKHSFSIAHVPRLRHVSSRLPKKEQANFAYSPTSSSWCKSTSSQTGQDESSARGANQSMVVNPGRGGCHQLLTAKFFHSSLSFIMSFIKVYFCIWPKHYLFI